MRPVPEFDPRQWLLKALRETSHAMESLAWNVDDDALDHRVDADEWSCREIAAHLCAMERRFVERLERIVRLDAPRVAAFDADSIAAQDEPDEREVFETLDEFGVLRRQSVYLLWSLDECDWERMGVHPYLGEMSILQVAREMNEHDLAHLWQMRRLCDRLEAATAVV